MLLHRYAILVAVCTLFLVVAGASVTSNEAGLSVPDWPLSYGKVMPEMTGGIFYEHGHRMVATTVDDDGVGEGGQGAFDEVGDGPVVARLDQASSNAAKEGFVIAQQGAPQDIRPVDLFVRGHRLDCTRGWHPSTRGWHPSTRG